MRIEDLADGGGQRTAGIAFESVGEQPVSVDRGMPVVAAVERRMQAARAVQIRCIPDLVLRLIREFALDARKSERREAIEDRGVAHTVSATAAAPASASQPEQCPTASSSDSAALQAPLFRKSSAMQRCSASCASPSAAAAR